MHFKFIQSRPLRGAPLQYLLLSGSQTQCARRVRCAPDTPSASSAPRSASPES